MNKQTRDYDEETCKLLKGKIAGSNYTREVQAALSEMGKTYADGYIARVVGGWSYNNDVWTAIKTIVRNRSKAKEANRKEVEELVAA